MELCRKGYQKVCTFACKMAVSLVVYIIHIFNMCTIHDVLYILMHIFNNAFDNRQVISNVPIGLIRLTSLTTSTCYAQCATVTNFALSATDSGQIHCNV